MESGDDLLFRAVSSQVPSALRALTSVFGMGTGASLSLLSPEILFCFQGLPFESVLRSLSRSRFGFLFGSRGGFRFWCGFLSVSHLENCTGKVDLKAFRVSLSLLRSSPRPISIGKLPHCCAFTADLLPHRLWGVLLLANGNLLLEVGFTLRCLQRLSYPHFASQLCRWHDNCCTRDASTPVLSY